MVTNPDTKNISRGTKWKRSPRKVKGCAVLIQQAVNGRTCWSSYLGGQETWMFVMDSVNRNYTFYFLTLLLLKQDLM